MDAEDAQQICQLSQYSWASLRIGLLSQALSLALLRFGAVHTCRVIPEPNSEIRKRLTSDRLCKQKEARTRAKAIVGNHVRL